MLRAHHAERPQGLGRTLMNVLVVDGITDMRRIIRNLLAQIGFSSVDEAKDATEALTKLKSGAFGLVISDWNLEPMTGFDLLRQVRADGKLKDTRFIMVSSESKTENVMAAKMAGVDGFVLKPFNGVTLQQKINSVVAGHNK